jgi:hypothetical protein
MCVNQQYLTEQTCVPADGSRDRLAEGDATHVRLEILRFGNPEKTNDRMYRANAQLLSSRSNKSPVFPFAVSPLSHGTRQFYANRPQQNC